MTRRGVEDCTEEPDMKTKEHSDVKGKHSVSFRCHTPDTILSITWLTYSSGTLRQVRLAFPLEKIYQGHN